MHRQLTPPELRRSDMSRGTKSGMAYGISFGARYRSDLSVVISGAGVVEARLSSTADCRRLTFRRDRHWIQQRKRGHFTPLASRGCLQIGVEIGRDC